ncbi:Pyocin activator protein PrtN [Paraburkholderia acidicola]|uniref:Pyocin activator protein PrtN n=1 Tax=Paraburkholderia acidicola TaxID=1912599 RepID=A0A2A4F587_9BURK|nr:pyocin activator PrtN family protein [Paraburkholderia acidicola]PCE27519.1 Pyocin activator protein PrtN [Paraburkholderia acidicola]
MNTVFLLMAQFGARAVIPIEEVQKAYFSHLEVDKLLAKVSRGDIPLPVVSAERSRKSARGVHLQDLAEYIDAQRAAAVRERNQFCGLK